MSTKTTRTAKTASQAYEESHAAVLAKLAELQELIAVHAAKQAATPSNWGWSGDMQSIDRQLEGMLEGLRASR